MNKKFFVELRSFLVLIFKLNLQQRFLFDLSDHPRHFGCIASKRQLVVIFKHFHHGTLLYSSISKFSKCP